MNSGRRRDDGPGQIGVLGASSFVGACLLQKLSAASISAVAYTRREIRSSTKNVAWRTLESELPPNQEINSAPAIPNWICLAPLAVLPGYFTLLEAHGVKRVVALSSTSRFTKQTSSDPDEQALVRNLAEAEMRVQQWAESRGVEWIILRPTLIYGSGQDRNIVEITRFIRRFGFFPVFGKACGLRQPVHVQDVVLACMAALHSASAVNCACNISGSEVLTYRDLVSRVFKLLGKKPRLIPIPLWMFSAAVALLRCVPRYSKWSSAMAERMNTDMIFDNSAAQRDFGFKPRPFILTAEDIPN